MKPDGPRDFLPVGSFADEFEVVTMTEAESCWFDVHRAMLDACCERELNHTRPNATTMRRFQYAGAACRLPIGARPVSHERPDH